MAPHRAGGLFGPETPSTPASPRPVRPEPAQPKPLPQPAERWINAELEDHAPDKPIATGQWYTLAFDVDVAQRATAIGSMTLLPDEQLFSDGIDDVLLTVQLDTGDFEISDRKRSLRLPRMGKSHFDIKPRHHGPSTLKATIHKDGNFIHQMELTFQVGATQTTPVQVTARGRPSAAVIVMHPRDIGLSMSPVAGGYDCVVWGAVSARARLSL